MSQTLSTGITLYGVGEADKKKMGEEALLSVWGDSLENISSLRIIHNYMVAKDKLLGTDTLETINKTITGAINELNRKTSINIRTIKVNDNPVENLDGVVNLEIPTKTSEIENDSHIDIETNTDIVDTTDIGFGDTINIITEVNRDENGHVQNIKTVKSTLPVVTTNTEITGNGNALTSLDVNNGIINLKKEETFATKSEFEDITNPILLNIPDEYPTIIDCLKYMVKTKNIKNGCFKISNITTDQPTGVGSGATVYYSETFYLFEPNIEYYYLTIFNNFNNSYTATIDLTNEKFLTVWNKTIKSQDVEIEYLNGWNSPISGSFATRIDNYIEFNLTLSGGLVDSESVICEFKMDTSFDTISAAEYFPVFRVGSSSIVGWVKILNSTMTIYNTNLTSNSLLRIYGKIKIRKQFQ